MAAFNTSQQQRVRTGSGGAVVAAAVAVAAAAAVAVAVYRWFVIVCCKDKQTLQEPAVHQTLLQHAAEELNGGTTCAVDDARGDAACVAIVQAATMEETEEGNQQQRALVQCSGYQHNDHGAELELCCCSLSRPHFDHRRPMMRVVVDAGARLSLVLSFDLVSIVCAGVCNMRRSDDSALWSLPASPRVRVSGGRKNRTNTTHTTSKITIYVQRFHLVFIYIVHLRRATTGEEEEAKKSPICGAGKRELIELCSNLYVFALMRALSPGICSALRGL
jgi:hypothetical protein